MSHTNRVDGEIWTQIDKLSQTPPVDPQPAEARVPAEPTDLDYRTAALNAAIEFHKTEGGIVTRHAKHFEKYLRGEAA